MKAVIALIATLFALPAFAGGTPVQQSGNVTPHHSVMWTTNGVVQDGGSATNGFLSEVGITKNGGCALGINSGLTTGPYTQLCFGVTSGSGYFALNSYGGAPNGSISFIINGITYSFPGPGNGDVLGPPSSADGDAAVFNGTGGTLLKDAGAPPQLTVTSVAALQALTVANLPANAQVLVTGYYNPGDAPTVTYTLSSSACPLGAGAGDGGAQIKPTTGSGCWLLNPQTAYDVRTWGAVAGGLDPNNNNATLINNVETYCQSTFTPTRGRPLQAIKITGGMRAYGVNSPVQLKCEGQLFGEISIIALSSTNIPCTTDAVVEVLSPSFIITVRDLTVNSNYLPVNGFANETNGDIHFFNILVDRWQGSCGSVTATGGSGGTNRREVTVDSTASLSVGMVSRGNGNVGGAGNGIYDRAFIVGIVDATHIIIDKPASGPFSAASLNFYYDSNGMIWGLNNSNAGGGIWESQSNEYESSDTTQCGGANCNNQNAYRYGAALLVEGQANDMSFNNIVMDLGITNVFMTSSSGFLAHRVELNAGTFLTPEPYVTNIIVAQGASDMQLDQFSNNGGAIDYFTLDGTSPRFRLNGMLTQSNSNAQISPQYWVQFWTNQTNVNASKIVLDPAVTNNNNSLGYYYFNQSAGSYTQFGPLLQYSSGVANAQFTQQISLSGASNFTFSGVADGATNLLTGVTTGSGCSGGGAPFSCMTAGDQVVVSGVNFYIVDFDTIQNTVTLNGSPASAGTKSVSDIPCNHTFLPQDSQTNFFFDVAGQNCGPYFSQVLPNGWVLGGFIWSDSVGGGSVTFNGEGVNLLYAGTNYSSISAVQRQYYQGAFLRTNIVALH